MSLRRVAAMAERGPHFPSTVSIIEPTCGVLWPSPEVYLREQPANGVPGAPLETLGTPFGESMSSTHSLWQTSVSCLHRLVGKRANSQSRTRAVNTGRCRWMQLALCAPVLSIFTSCPADGLASRARDMCKRALPTGAQRPAKTCTVAEAAAICHPLSACMRLTSMKKGSPSSSRASRIRWPSGR